MGHNRERMRDFIAGLFQDLLARDLRTRHGAAQPRTLLIDKHGNKSFARQLKRNVDVIERFHYHSNEPCQVYSSRSSGQTKENSAFIAFLP